MAVAMEGFSIREYASRMRGIDVVKCWPFDEANEEVVGAILPPITIKKFSWWFDKLQLVQDNEEVSDLDSESLQSKRMRRGKRGKSTSKTKAKAKAPKKRSIVELFAVAPLVERVNSSDDDDDENGEYSDDDEDSDDVSDGEDRIPTPKFSSLGKVGLNCKSKRKIKKKGILSMMKKEKIVMIKDLKKNKVTKKQKGKKVAADLSTKKKDKPSKVKLPTSADIVTSSSSATYSKDLFDAFSTHSKKPRLKRLTTERSNCKIPSHSKFFPNGHQTVFTVRGILKDQNKMVAAENFSDSLLQDASKLNHCDTQHVNKHVTFSAKDDVLEPSWDACPAMDLELRSNSFSDVSLASLAKGQTAEMEKILSINETKETEEERTKCTKDKFAVQQVIEKQVSSRHHVSDTSNFVLRQHDFSQENLFCTTLPFGHGSPHSESHNRVTLHDELHTCSSELPTIPEEPCIPNLMIPVFNHSSDSFSCSQRLLGISGDVDPKHDSDYSMDFLKAYPQPPTPYHSLLQHNLNGRSLFSSQNIRKNHCEQALSHQWIPHLSPKELMHSICSLPDWNSRPSMYGETSMHEDFVGLPLNSLGEFISLNPSGKDGFNQIRSMSAVAGPSLSSVTHNNVLNNPMMNQIDVRSWNEMTLRKNPHKTCRIKDSGNMIEHCVLPSRVGMIEQYGIGKRNTVMQAFDPCFNSMESVMDRMKVFHIECRPHDHIEEHPRNDFIRQHGDPDHISLHVTRSTMRLMGKEFTIGGRDLEGCENKEVSATKQILIDHCGGNGTESSSIKCQDFPKFVVHPVLGKLRETVADFPKAKINQASERDPQMMVSESNISSQFFDSHYNVRNQNDVTLCKEILIPEIYPNFSLASFPSPNRHNCILQESFSSAHISPPESSRISVSASTLLDSSQNVRTSCNVPEYKQTPLHGTQFAFKFPFADSESEKPIHPSWSQNSFKFASPYLLDSRQKGTFMDYRYPCSAPDSIGYPCSISGANCGTDESVFSGPEPFHLSTCSSSQNAFTSASLAHHPSFPVHPGFSMQSRHGPKFVVDDQLKSRFSVRVPAHGKRSKKRLPSASNGSKKCSKIPKVRIQDDCSNAVVEVEAGNSFEGDIQCSKQVSESAQQHAGLVERGQSGVHNHKDQLGECTGMDSFKLVGAPRSGPVKLTAGARYILKACQKNDQANTEPSNSTTPIVASTYDRKVLGSEKSSEVYMF